MTDSHHAGHPPSARAACHLVVPRWLRRSLGGSVRFSGSLHMRLIVRRPSVYWSGPFRPWRDRRTIRRFCGPSGGLYASAGKPEGYPRRISASRQRSTGPTSRGSSGECETRRSRRSDAWRRRWRSGRALCSEGRRTPPGAGRARTPRCRLSAIPCSWPCAEPPFSGGAPSGRLGVQQYEDYLSIVLPSSRAHMATTRPSIQLTDTSLPSAIRVFTGRSGKPTGLSARKDST